MADGTNGVENIPVDRSGAARPIHLPDLERLSHSGDVKHAVHCGVVDLVARVAQGALAIEHVARVPLIASKARPGAVVVHPVCIVDGEEAHVIANVVVGRAGVSLIEPGADLPHRAWMTDGSDGLGRSPVSRP